MAVENSQVGSTLGFVTFPQGCYFLLEKAGMSCLSVLFRAYAVDFSGNVNKYPATPLSTEVPED